MVSINSKGLTLLEVLITLAILGVIIASFFTLFTSTNLNIGFSSKKVEAVREGKSILDEIHSTVTNPNNSNNQDFNNTVEDLLKARGHEGNYKMFHTDDDFYNYQDKKIHCLIEEQGIIIEANNGTNNIDSKNAQNKDSALL